MWDLPRPGIEPVSPSLSGGSSTTGAARKPHFLSVSIWPSHLGCVPCVDRRGLESHVVCKAREVSCCPFPRLSFWAPSPPWCPWQQPLSSHQLGGTFSDLKRIEGLSSSLGAVKTESPPIWRVVNDRRFSLRVLGRKSKTQAPADEAPGEDPACEKSKCQRLSRAGLFATPWAVARQAPPSVGFPRQEYWGGLPSPSPGGSSRPRDRTRVFLIVGRCFTI